MPAKQTTRRQRTDTVKLRKKFKEYFNVHSRQQLPDIRGTATAADLFRHLRMRAALRNHSYAAEVSDNRVSERGLHFLVNKSEENERNLSTPKYFTPLNTKVSIPPLESKLKPENFKTLTSKRLEIPKYQVPANLPELQQIRSLVTSDWSTADQHSTETSTSSHKGSKPESKSLDLNDWINLLTRPVQARPDFAEPIQCKTPKCQLSHPDFQKPSKGFFKHIDKKAASREFIVHPEFVSEVVKLQYIQGQSSNPLKYGWA